MRCACFELGTCRSCTVLDTPYPQQLADKDARVRSQLAGVVPPDVFREIVASNPVHFRTRAKLAVGGTAAHPILGIVRPDGSATDIRLCPIHNRHITDALPAIARFIARARLTPYDLTTRRGELKYVHVTAAPNGELLVRFVLRSTEAEARIRKHLASLLADVPAIRVATLNLLPVHKAVTEGERDILLTDEHLLAMPLGDVTLHLTPASFFQTNTAIAQALYGRAQELLGALPLPTPARIYDLYCGVGGFALHLAGVDRHVTGVEISEPAIAAAQYSAEVNGVADRVELIAADAWQWLATAPRADLVVVNPPRRGIGTELAGWLNEHAPAVLYSSCNAVTLAKDLAHMPNLRAMSAQVFDMFPHTTHTETLVALVRR
ncbi:hypothetical protein BSZ39_04010 [Bowdeniella nasicola]|uniref:23S rRNA (Uracil(747)-C(5))-methyltransferase n=1 Tax=Bowdeniella nasicola TaxID=208480 RepID=A0A1Q5Q451_9ACTO|nr:hypothetical protein BSZ39_04010 [Bowdeniella nasicola]